MPTLNKLFEKAVWLRLKDWATKRGIPHTLQMAGRVGANALDASFCVQEAICHHTEKGSKVFACFIGIEKAFDKIWWNGLYYRLYRLGVRDKLWHLIKNWFCDSEAAVLFDGQCTETFKITRGIKQGGVLSMFFFTVYLMDMHEFIDQSNDALWISDVYMGSPAFADDITLLSGTKSGLNRMKNGTKRYGELWRISFSAVKTMCMVFGEPRVNSSSSSNCISNRVQTMYYSIHE